MKKLSIGSWAFLFNQEKPTTDFHELLHNLAHLGFDGVELGGFSPHPNPEQFDTLDKRLQLKRMVEDHGLAFSALAADLWSQKLVSVDDHVPFMAAFEKNLAFADDLGIHTLRIDTVEPIAAIESLNLSGPQIMKRVVRAFDACAKQAAAKGITLSWEFDPGFPLRTPSEILELAERVRDDHQNPNFGVLFNTCHAHTCAAVGVNQRAAQDILPDGALELLQKLKGMITHVHLIDADGTLNEHHTSARRPFGEGSLNFDLLIPELLASNVPSDWWCVDLCFLSNAWDLAAESRRCLDRWRRKYDVQSQARIP